MTFKKICYTNGQKFEGTMLSYIKDVQDLHKGARRAFFRCDCGRIKEILISTVKSRSTISCGCYRASNTVTMNITHGQSKKGKKTGAYKAWLNMLRRVKKDPDYVSIAVCERWKTFVNFYQDMGDRPDGLTLDRINPLGDYEPSNCRWATRQEQTDNRSCTKYATIGGDTKTVAEWCRIKCVNYMTIYSRIKTGMAPEDAILKKTGSKK